jgi:glycosyltransferase involved in cell wall biosynthesis
MISIITAIHNQLTVNKLFVDSLKKNTRNPYELIIIDNNSTDGSREFFEKMGAIVIHNAANYSYPYCQNQGIARAKYDALAFFNNDIILSKDWDVHLLHVLGKDGYDAVSFASNDRGILRKEEKALKRRWKWIKYPILTLLGVSKFSLKLMLWLMYGNWDKFCAKKFEQYGYTMSLGVSGSVVAMTRRGIEKVGLWDESMQGADFDLFARCKKRHLEHGDIQPLSIISGVYLHHFVRLTLKSKRKPVQFADAHKLRSLEEKWGKEWCEKIYKDLE